MATRGDRPGGTGDPGGALVPFRPNLRLTYLNRERFAQYGLEPPTTVEDLKATAEWLKEMTGQPKVTLSLAEGDPAAVTISEWIVSFGGDPLLLNDDGSRPAFRFLQDLWRNGLLARESLFGTFDTEVDTSARRRRGWARTGRPRQPSWPSRGCSGAWSSPP